MGIGKMRNDQPTASGHAASFQSFHHAQILQGEKGAVGLAEVERHGVDESGTQFAAPTGEKVPAMSKRAVINGFIMDAPKRVQMDGHRENEE